MKKKLRALFCISLSAALTALGFAACTTSKSASKKGDGNSPTPVIDSDTVPRPRPDDPMKVVYGPPPVRFQP